MMSEVNTEKKSLNLAQLLLSKIHKRLLQTNKEKSKNSM